MRKRVTLVLPVALLFACSTAFAAPPPSYHLVWQDDFSGNRLDQSKWFIMTAVRDSAQQTADAVQVRPWDLHIRTYTRDGHHYTGFINTRGRFMAVYEYIEARINFHDAPGTHCAFWLYTLTIDNAIIGDPQHSGTEIDIVEHRVVDASGKDIRNLASMNLHWDGYGPDHKHLGKDWVAPVSLNDSWHTYALLWTQAGYVFYIDDVERWRSNMAVSQTPEEIHLTCEVNGWSGQPPVNGYGPRQSTPYGMDVNWVRVWQK